MDDQVIRHRKGVVHLPPQLPELSPSAAIAIAMQLYESAMHALRYREENSVLRQDGDSRRDPE